MDENSLLFHSLLVGAILFSIGLIGFLSRRNMIVMFLAAEMMLQGVSVSLIAWGRFHNDWGGQVLVIFSLTIAACEAAIALALVLMLYHRNGKLDIDAWQDLREGNLPAHMDLELPEDREPMEAWPHLTPSGVEPKHHPGDLPHRQHVRIDAIFSSRKGKKPENPKVQRIRINADERGLFFSDPCNPRNPRGFPSR